MLVVVVVIVVYVLVTVLQGQVSMILRLPIRSGSVHHRGSMSLYIDRGEIEKSAAELLGIGVVLDFLVDVILDTDLAAGQAEQVADEIQDCIGTCVSLFNLLLLVGCSGRD